LLGGIETFLLNMNAHMSEQCVFDYIILGDDFIHGQAIEDKGARVLMVPSPRKNPAAYLRRLWSVLKDSRRQCEIVYFNLFSMVHVLPVWMCRLLGYRIILHAHNNGLQHKGRLYSLLHNIGKRLLKTGNYTRWTNSRASSDCMFGKGVCSELIYNAIDVERFAFDNKVRGLVRSQNDATDALVLGFVGRLTSEKNLLFLVRVFHELICLCSNAVLWVIGEGEMEAPMRDLAQQLDAAGRIRWFGRRCDVPRLMMAMDAFVLPSLFEGLGIVLIEAQASGLPCVTSANVVPDLVKITDRLRFVELNSGPKAWARAVVEIAPCMERESGCAAVVGTPFDISTEARRMEKLFQAVSANPEGISGSGMHADC
jgi:glycosyltransferase involved in cell wall biosynthesis